MSIATPRMTHLPIEQRGITLADFLVPIRIGERLGVRVRNIGLIVVGAMLIYLTARMAIPIPGSPVPVTGQTFGVLLVSGALGFRRGLLAVSLYVLIGAIGLPWFAEGKSGVSVILGATGGYLVGFIVAGAVVGRLAELGWDRGVLGAVGAMLIGNLVIYAVGVPWLIAVTGFDLATGVAKGLTPFLLGDALKLALAAAAFPVAWWVVGRRPYED